MSYLSTVNEIQAAAIAVNPTGRFDHGGHVDISQMYEGEMPFIYLYPPVIYPGIDPDFIDTNILTIGFWFQDDPKSSTLERKLLLSQSDDLSKQFLDKLLENKYIKITDRTQKDPAFKEYQGCWSGFILRISYQNFSACP
jgi:hypothetical protein